MVISFIFRFALQRKTAFYRFKLLSKALPTIEFAYFLFNLGMQNRNNSTKEG